MRPPYKLQTPVDNVVELDYDSPIQTMGLHKSTMNIALKVAIANTGRTQQDIAKQLKVHPVRLSQWIHGVAKPSEQQLKRLQRVLECEDVGFAIVHRPVVETVGA